jgi:hypothetical protein
MRKILINFRYDVLLAAELRGGRHSDWELLGLKMGVKPACHTQNLSKTVQKDKGKTKKGTKFSQNRGYLHRRPSKLSNFRLKRFDLWF